MRCANPKCVGGWVTTRYWLAEMDPDDKPCESTVRCQYCEATESAPLVLLQKWKEADPWREFLIDGHRAVNVYEVELFVHGDVVVERSASTVDEAIRLSLADFAAKEGRP